MSCQVNGVTYNTSPFQVYVTWAGQCNNDNSGRSQMDITASPSPINKQYLQFQNSGTNYIFQEELQTSDYFYYPNLFDGWLFYSFVPGCQCGQSGCVYTPSCVLKTCTLIEVSTGTPVPQFTIYSYPNQTMVFRIDTSSTVSVTNVKLKCYAEQYDNSNAVYIYSNQFQLSIVSSFTPIGLNGNSGSTSAYQTFSITNYVPINQLGYCSTYGRTITSCSINQYGITAPYIISTSISGQNFIVQFDTSKFRSQDNFLLSCSFSNGLSFETVFSLQVVNCYYGATIAAIQPLFLYVGTTFFPLQALNTTVISNYLTVSNSGGCNYTLTYKLFFQNNTQYIATYPLIFDTWSGQLIILNYFSFTGFNFSEKFFVQATLNTNDIYTSSVFNVTIQSYNCSNGVGFQGIQPLYNYTGFQPRQLPKVIFASGLNYVQTLYPQCVTSLRYYLVYQNGTIYNLQYPLVFNTYTGTLYIRDYFIFEGFNYTQNFFIQIYLDSTNYLNSSNEGYLFQISIQSINCVFLGPSGQNISVNSDNGDYQKINVYFNYNHYQCLNYIAPADFPIKNVYDFKNCNVSTPIKMFDKVDLSSWTSYPDKPVFYKTLNINVTFIQKMSNFDVFFCYKYILMSYDDSFKPFFSRLIVDYRLNISTNTNQSAVLELQAKQNADKSFNSTLYQLQMKQQPFPFFVQTLPSTIIVQAGIKQTQVYNFPLIYSANSLGKFSAEIVKPNLKMLSAACEFLVNNTIQYSNFVSVEQTPATNPWTCSDTLCKSVQTFQPQLSLTFFQNIDPNLASTNFDRIEIQIKNQGLEMSQKPLQYFLQVIIVSQNSTQKIQSSAPKPKQKKRIQGCPVSINDVIKEFQLTVDQQNILYNFNLSQFGPINTQKCKNYFDVGMKITKFRSSGVVTLTFNQNLISPKNISQIDYSQLFEVWAQKIEDLTIVQGNYTGYRQYIKNYTENQIQYDNCYQSSCLSQQIYFSWKVIQHTQEFLKIQLDFVSPGSITTSKLGKDQLKIKIISQELFIGAKTAKYLNAQTKKQCDSHPFNRDYYLCYDLIQISQQSSMMSSLSAMFMLSNLLQNGNAALSILLGYSMAYLIQAIRIVQLIVFMGLIDCDLPDLIFVFYENFLSFASIDLLQGSQISQYLFKSFSSTSEFSQRFLDFQIQDLNFLINQASILYMAALITINYMGSKLIKKLAAIFFTNSCMRKIGMKFGNAQLYNPLNQLFIEGYYELMIAQSLQMVAFKRYGISNLMINVDDKTNSLLSILIILYLAFLNLKTAHINFKYSGKLNNKKVVEKYKIYFEDISSRNMINSFCQTFFLMRRMIQVLTLVLLNQFPVFQGIIFMLLSLSNLIFILRMRPFKSTFNSRIEITNEFMTLLASYFVFCWQYESVNYSQEIDVQAIQKFKQDMSWCLIAIIFFSFIFNLSISLTLSINSLIKDLQDFYKQWNIDQKLQKRIKRKQELVKMFPQLLKEIENQQDMEKAKIFCFNWKKERHWCNKNKIDIQKIPEEIQYQLYIKKYDNFKNQQAQENYQSQKKQEIQFQNEKNKMKKVSFLKKRNITQQQKLINNGKIALKNNMSIIQEESLEEFSFSERQQEKYSQLNELKHNKNYDKQIRNIQMEENIQQNSSFNVLNAINKAIAQIVEERKNDKKDKDFINILNIKSNYEDFNRNKDNKNLDKKLHKQIKRLSQKEIIDLQNNTNDELLEYAQYQNLQENMITILEKETNNYQPNIFQQTQKLNNSNQFSQKKQKEDFSKSSKQKSNMKSEDSIYNLQRNNQGNSFIKQQSDIKLKNPVREIKNLPILNIPKQSNFDDNLLKKQSKKMQQNITKKSENIQQNQHMIRQNTKIDQIKSNLNDIEHLIKQDEQSQKYLFLQTKY